MIAVVSKSSFSFISTPRYVILLVLLSVLLLSENVVLEKIGLPNVIMLDLLELNFINHSSPKFDYILSSLCRWESTELSRIISSA